jgi:hypothetical protein
MHVPTLHSKPVRLLYFWIGIAATTAYRAIIFFTDANPVLLKVTWYIGTIGFIIYFAHRYQVSGRRARAIEEYRLTEKIPQLSELTLEERSALSYVLSTLRSTKEKWNYIFIFATSAIALIAGVVIDFS